MYKRSKIHTYDLGNAIKKTKDMMRKVRGIKAYEMASLERPRSRRHISGMTDKEILEEFAQHENEVQTYLQERQKIIDKAAYMVFSDDNNRRGYKKKLLNCSITFHIKIIWIRFMK